MNLRKHFREGRKYLGLRSMKAVFAASLYPTEVLQVVHQVAGAPGDNTVRHNYTNHPSQNVSARPTIETGALNHVDASGHASMVDIAGKSATTLDLNLFNPKRAGLPHCARQKRVITIPVS